MKRPKWSWNVLGYNILGECSWRFNLLCTELYLHVWIYFNSPIAYFVHQKIQFQQSNEESHSYIPTPGIDVGSYDVDGVGRLSIWDAAGHIEYHMTHGMFLGSRYSIAAVVYDLQEEHAVKVNVARI